MRVFKMLDSNPNVLEWNSEETIVPYPNPLTGRVSRYFVDVYAKIKTKSGDVRKFLIEIKPHSQTLPPNQKQKNMKTLRYQQAEYIKNQAKWKSASEFCSKREMKFVLLTEKMLEF